MSKPSIPQGTRDFSPSEVRKRQYIFSTLKNIFENYGFQPLETPAMENLTTLTGKYGEEGDRLIFKILNNGLHEKKEADKAKLNSEWEKLLAKPFSTPVITERALRYDLTIPFARYVVMHQNDIALPFRRYQMQPVWRADRPQKGRYREFWQCDADIVGSTSLINEAELVSIYRQAFYELSIPAVTVKLNSRKLLAGISELSGMPDKMMEITIALDKIDKIGWDGVHKELSERGITENGINKIKEIIEITGSNNEKLGKLKDIMVGCEIGVAGVAELERVLHYHESLQNNKWDSKIEIDISLARGLNYYTGIITEVTCSAVKIGSIGGGGRYDDLTSLFGLKNLSGVGISFGIDRIYDVMEELSLFPENVSVGAEVLIVNFGEANEDYALGILKALRNAGISAEIYPDAVKFDKQMKYANRRNMRYVILPGDDERKNNLISIKNFMSGAQTTTTVEDCIAQIKEGK